MSRYIAMQSSECIIISKMFLIYLISYGCNGGALVFLGGAEASASPSFALPMFITIKKIIILHLFLGVPAATVGGTGTPWHTRATPLCQTIRCCQEAAATVHRRTSVNNSGNGYRSCVFCTGCVVLGKAQKKKENSTVDTFLACSKRTIWAVNPPKRTRGKILFILNIV